MLRTATGLFHDSGALEEQKVKYQIADEWNEDVFNLIGTLHPNNADIVPVTEAKRKCIMVFFPREYSGQQDTSEFLQHLLNISNVLHLLRQDEFLYRSTTKKFESATCSDDKPRIMNQYEQNVFPLQLPHIVSVLKTPIRHSSDFKANAKLTGTKLETLETTIETIDQQYQWVVTEVGANRTFVLKNSSGTEISRGLWESWEWEQIKAIKKLESEETTLSECLYRALSCRPTAMAPPKNPDDDDHSCVKSEKEEVKPSRYFFIQLLIFTFTDRAGKINKPILIDTPININTIPYEVIAVVYHKGQTPRGGHYTCKAKRSEKDGSTRTYYYDDDNPPIIVLDFSPPDGFTPYLVLCERVPS
jgi:hypothetical protein